MCWITTYNSVRPIKKSPWPFSANSVFKSLNVFTQEPYSYCQGLLWTWFYWSVCEWTVFLKWCSVSFIFVAILLLGTRLFGYIYFSHFIVLISVPLMFLILLGSFSTQQCIDIGCAYVKLLVGYQLYAKHYSEHLACILSFSLNIQGLLLLSPFYSWGNKRKAK